MSSYENHKIYYEADCDLSVLDGQKIAVIGYGSQGHAHALNLKESGCDVIVGLYEGSKSWAKAEAQGLEVFTAAEAAKQADIIMILINDELQADMYKKDVFLIHICLKLIIDQDHNDVCLFCRLCCCEHF